MSRPAAIALILSSGLAFSAPGWSVETITVATVNHADMSRLQELSTHFKTLHPDISIKWVVADENILRYRQTADISIQSGQFDVLTISTYEASLWANKGWLVPMSELPVDYDADDIFPRIRQGLSLDNTLYALPINGESTLTFYRTDLFEHANLSMPDQPTWTQLRTFAAQLNHPETGQYGMCLRGKAGWSENVVVLSILANAFGARWFNEQWQAQLMTAEWKAAADFYVDILRRYGPPAVTKYGFNETLALFNSGKCAMWVDASLAAPALNDPSQSKVVGRVGYALAPIEVTDKGAAWLHAWGLAIPITSRHKEAAKTFITWATSKSYIQMVADTYGINNVPSGSRISTYSESYLKAAPYAGVTLEMIQRSDPAHPSVQPVPYVGIQYVSIPEFQAIGTRVGKLFSQALEGKMSVDETLKAAQIDTEREMQRARPQ